MSLHFEGELYSSTNKKSVQLPLKPDKFARLNSSWVIFVYTFREGELFFCQKSPIPLPLKPQNLMVPPLLTMITRLTLGINVISSILVLIQHLKHKTKIVMHYHGNIKTPDTYLHVYKWCFVNEI